MWTYQGDAAANASLPLSDGATLVLTEGRLLIPMRSRTSSWKPPDSQPSVWLAEGGQSPLKLSPHGAIATVPGCSHEWQVSGAGAGAGNDRIGREAEREKLGR